MPDSGHNILNGVEQTRLAVWCGDSAGNSTIAIGLCLDYLNYEFD